MPTWKDVQDYFEKDGTRCSDCEFNRECQQSHPYGETTATEYWNECVLLDGRDGDGPEDCPGVAEKEDDNG